MIESWNQIIETSRKEARARHPMMVSEEVMDALHRLNPEFARRIEKLEDKRLSTLLELENLEGSIAELHLEALREIVEKKVRTS